MLILCYAIKKERVILSYTLFRCWPVGVAAYHYTHKNFSQTPCKIHSGRKTRQVVLDAPKVLAKTLSLSVGDYSEIKLSTGKQLL